LGAFFVFGALMSLVTGLALLFPGESLEPLWRANPGARAWLSTLGPWGIALMFSVSLTCVLSAAGLWRGAEWGHRLATGLLLVNVVGDLVRAFSGAEPGAAIGVPIGAALVAYLWSAGVREYFALAMARRPTTG
jgi:hypothetical protein